GRKKGLGHVRGPIKEVQESGSDGELLARRWNVFTARWNEKLLQTCVVKLPEAAVVRLEKIGHFLQGGIRCRARVERILLQHGRNGCTHVSGRRVYWSGARTFQKRWNTRNRLAKDAGGLRQHS